MCPSFLLLLLFKKTHPTYFEEQYFLMFYKTVRKLYDKMIQSFNFPFPEHVIFDSEKLDIFSWTSKKFLLFNRNL